MILSNDNSYAIVSNNGGNILCWRHFSAHLNDQIDILYPECPYEYSVGNNKTSGATHGGAYVIAGVLADGGIDEIYTVGIPNVLNCKGSEEFEDGVHTLHFSAKQIKECSNYKFGIVSEFELKSQEKAKSQFILRTRVRSYEPLPFTLLHVYRMYVPFQCGHSILKIDNKVEEKIGDDDLLYCCAENWNSVEIEGEHGLTSIQTKRNSIYDVNQLQIISPPHTGFVLVDSIRHIYLMSGLSTPDMNPKVSITFTPY